MAASPRIDVLLACIANHYARSLWANEYHTLNHGVSTYIVSFYTLAMRIPFECTLIICITLRLHQIRCIDECCFHNLICDFSIYFGTWNTLQLKRSPISVTFREFHISWLTENFFSIICCIYFLISYLALFLLSLNGTVFETNWRAFSEEAIKVVQSRRIFCSMC